MIIFLFRPLKPVHFVGIRLHGLLPRFKDRFVQSLAGELATKIIHPDFLQQKLTSAETLQKSKPVIELHIDNFLQHRLKTELPVVAMFIGEKITAQLKELFMKELDELFPSVMSQFIAGLSHSAELQNEIVVKLSNIRSEVLEERFYKTFKKEIRRYEIIFTLAGLIAGFIQLSLTIASPK
jgi:uncharacterized membrane protein YheB (UPF0754 family)